MGLLIAVAITLAVLGSILWVKPSPRDKAISELRTHALGLGFKVRLLDQKLATNLFPWIDNYRLFTLYELSLRTEEKPPTPKPLVVRLHYGEDVHELDRQDELREQLEKLNVLDELPESAEAIIISASGIAMLWSENSKLGVEQVDSVYRVLNACKEHSRLWLKG